MIAHMAVGTRGSAAVFQEAPGNQRGHDDLIPEARRSKAKVWTQPRAARVVPSSCEPCCSGGTSRGCINLG